MIDLEKLKFPIGPFIYDPQPSSQKWDSWLNTLGAFPENARNVISNISNEKMSWRYRPEGWSIRQVIHHCADSHMNGLIRIKLALTEDNPIIRPYREERWAGLIDGNELDVQHSLNILTAVHHKWVLLLKGADDATLDRPLVHPDHDTAFTIRSYVGNYAWHCDHHLAHILQAINAQGKYGSVQP